MALDDSAARQGEYLWRVHGYTNEYIRFADGKAAVVIAWVTAVIGGLYSIHLHERSLTVSWWGNALIWAAFGLLASAFVVAVLTVLPRLWGRQKPCGIVTTFLPDRDAKDREGGLIFWDDILAHGRSERFQAAVRSLTAEAVNDQVARHVFILASVARSKYRMVNWSVVLAALGSVSAAIATTALK